VSEGAQKRDLNNDFDQTDLILTWIDLGSPGTLHVLPPFALVARTPLVDGLRGLVTVSEPASSFLGTDFNGDGDVNDPVAFVVHMTAAPGTATSLGLAVTRVLLNGADVLLSVDEAAQGNADRNGNGSTNDVVETYLDLGDASPAPRGLGIIATARTVFRLTADEVRIAVTLPEGQSATYFDLNNDGDATDAGLELIAVNPGVAPPSLIVPTPFFAGIADAGNAPPLRTADGTYAFPTSEPMAGMDLNADGDLLDTVLCLTRIQ
jgi:hypothetical protein